jgi:hypothetical protein
MSFSRKYLPGSIFGLLALVLQTWQAVLAQPQDSTRPKSSKPPVRVTISKETTWITAPLREDGYPDYVRYLNEKLSEGVTVENNAMAPLARTMGLLEFDDQARAEYCMLLGIEPPPKDGNYFESWSSYTARTPEAEQPRVPPGDKRLQKDYFAQLVEEAASRPWTRKEFPHVAKWLDRNERHLDDIVAASKLPRAYSPLIAVPNEDFEHSMLVGALILDGYSTRDGAEALCCRAMLRASNDDCFGAASDLLASNRLAVLVAVKPNLVCFLTGKQIECKSRRAMIQLCAYAPFSRKEIQDFSRRWKYFPTIPTVARAYDIGARLEHLDAATYLAREGWQVLFDLTAFIIESSAQAPAERPKRVEWPQALTAAITRLVRWDEPLKLASHWYDRLVRIAQIEDQGKQTIELNSFDEDLKQLENEARQMLTPVGFWFHPRSIPTDRTSKILVALLLPPIHGTLSVARELETYRSMFNVSMALCEYRADYKRFPDTLQKLAPVYIEHIPTDDFGRRELVYRKTAAGYLLYSLGDNGRDDGGKEWSEEHKEADDIVIRVPATNSRMRTKR